MVDLLEDGLVGHVIDVVLVRRPARPVAGRASGPRRASSRSAGKSGATMWLIWRVEWPAPRISTRTSSGRMCDRLEAPPARVGPGRRRGDREPGRAPSVLGPPPFRRDHGPSARRQVERRRQGVERPTSRPSRTTGSIPSSSTTTSRAGHEDDGRLVIRRRRSRSIRRPSVPPSGTTGSASRAAAGSTATSPDASGRRRSRSGGRSFGGALGWIARLGHQAGRTSGFGTSASPTWWSSSWYEPMNARRVRAVGPNVSNSSRAQAVGLERPHEVGEPRPQLVDDRRGDRLVHPRPDLDRRGVEPALPDRPAS